MRFEMFPFAPYLFKSLWRHRARTLLTIIGAAVAIFVFCMVEAVQQGLERLTSDEDAQRTLIVFQENRFCPTSSRLPEDYARTIAKLPGVRSVMPVQVWTNNCRASLDIIVFNGVHPEQLRAARNLTLISGSWDPFESERDAAIIGQSVAKRRGLKAGSQFTIGDLSVSVVGVFSSPTPSEENLIFTSLAFLQMARGLDGAGLVTQHEVFVEPGSDPDSVASNIDSVLKSGPVATTTRLKGAFQTSTLSDLVDLIGFAHWLGYASVGLVLSLVATTMLMSVHDRMKEHVVLQVLGMRPWRIFRMVLAESMLLCFVGGSIGMIICLALLSFGGFAIGAEGVTIAFRPSLDIATSAISVSILVGIVAGFVPAAQTARVDIVPILRDS
ncbi:MAG: ABC transporter permease [Pirellula sp.]